jgi:hypothetical protein
MVGMAASLVKSDHYIRLNPAQMGHNFSNSLGGVSAIQLAILIIQKKDLL